MGIWIRSQNRKDLLEVNKVYIKTDNSLWSASVCLGEYNSDERACEVLEEIQDQIDFWKWCNATDFATAITFMKDFFEAESVYKMPGK